MERQLTSATRSSRRSPRFRVLLDASATPLGSRDGVAGPYELTIYDLSRDGFRTDAGFEWTVGDELRIVLPGVGPAGARIVRAEGDLLGCIFAEPLSPAQLDRCTAASTVVWPDFVEPPGHAGRGSGRLPDGADTAAGRSEMVEDDPERWPRPVRAAIAVGGGLLLWGTIALVIF